MNISILDMGKTKKRNVRETILEILTKEFPLNIRKIYNKVKKDYNLAVTYQAVFKLVKEMKEDGILELNGEHEYKLNLTWIKQLEDEIRMIRKNYSNINSQDTSAETQNNINSFISETAPKIKEYLGKDKSCIIGISGGGRLYGLALWRYLSREGLDSKYLDYDTFEEVSNKGIHLNKQEVQDKRIIIVDSAIYSGRTYHSVMKKLNSYKNKLGIKDLKYAVDKDHVGLSDFCRIKA